MYILVSLSQNHDAPHLKSLVVAIGLRDGNSSELSLRVRLPRAWVSVLYGP